ncbi:DUF1751 domain-containing protein [Isachenkonia alkalipeptolytica]|uniref:DUF1751 domain-containing protein n=1 Tax=Isachenkonia alkalipeptolytica TaxID=2565777 RepID=A0AA43XN62_9CLOT|nr:DUF1751 domain-containing protein [Isachenkonia alkalipeptolytica]NBG89404.1 DUF1751 domain-containing protein [Isachenkonia alkalipeptolytica]
MKIIKGLYIGILLFLNTALIGLELYKNTIRDQWAEGSVIGEEAYYQLQQLHGVTNFITLLLTFLILGGALGLVLWKKKELIKPQIIATLGISLLFYVTALITALITDAPRGNLSQHVHSMTGAVAVILIFLLISRYFNRNERKVRGLIH